MAKSKSKSKKRHNPSAGRSLNYGGLYPQSRRRRDRVITAIVVIIAAVGFGAYWWWSWTSEAEFLALAAEGEYALAEIETDISLGDGHFAAGETHTYRTQFPTSGIHHPVPTEPGFYETSRPPSQLVHAVEHGHIVIYYERPGLDALAKLKQWAALYPGHWDGIVATAMPGLGEKVVLTAWTKRLILKRFDAAAAAAFIDKFRGRGPENQVR